MRRYLSDAWYEKITLTVYEQILKKHLPGGDDADGARLSTARRGRQTKRGVHTDGLFHMRLPRL